MKARRFTKVYMLAMSLALICWPATAPAQYSLTTVATPLSPDPINTGPGPTTGGGGIVVSGSSNYQWVAAQFTLTNPAAITQVQGWFSPQIGKPGTPCNSPCTVNVVIRANNNTYPTEPIPGGVIWSQTYTVTPPTTDSAWITFSNYTAVLAAGTYWVAFEPPVNSGLDVGFVGPASGTGTGVTLLPEASYAWYSEGNGGYINYLGGPPNPTLPALTVSGYSLGTDSGNPLIVSGTFARTVTQGSIFNYDCGQNLNPVGNVGQTNALQWNICPGVYSASAYGTITANPKTYQGNILEAGAYSATGPNGSSGAGRGIVFSTYMNTTGADIPNVQVNAILNGSISGASSDSPVDVAGAIYVFDTVYFTSLINSVVPNSSLLGNFLLGGNNVVAGEVSPDEANLGQAIFQSKYVDDSWDNNSQLVVCQSDSCLQGYEVSTAGFDLPADAFFTVMFDVSAASQGPTSGQTTSIGDFLSTLEADPQYFFTDGSPTAQYPYGTPITGIVGPLTAAAVPATPVNISLSPSSQSTPVGSTTTVTATVTDANNNPVPDAIVRFSITSGPHAGFSMPVGTGDGTATLPNGSLIPVGSAIFNYTDTLGTAGTDSISASVGSLAAATPAQVTWTTPGPLYTLTLSPPTASIALGSGQTYTATGVDFFGNSTSTGTITYSISPDGSCTGATCTPAATGPHTVTGTGSNPVIGAITGTATLTATSGTPSLVITASSPSMIYGGTVPAVTPLYTYGSVTLSSTPPSGLTAPTCSAPGVTSTSNVGSYATSCSGASDSNYTISYAPGSLTVNAASLTITASSTSMTYGGTVPAVTPLYTYGSLTLSSTAPSGLTAPTCSAPGVSSTSAVGSYPTSCSGASDSNYTIGYAGGSLTVGPASLTITASSPTMTLGGTVPAITPLYTYGSLTLSSTAPSGLTAPTCSAPGVTSSSSVGTYATSCSGASDSNYTIGYAPGSLTVNAASLTITASGPTMTLGGTVPAITPLYTYGSLTLSSTAPSGLTAPTCSAPGVTSSSSVGTYPTSCSGAVDSNYTIGYVGGILTIVNPTGKTNPVIMWPTPAPITYGTPLSSTQLDATANVAGTFVYTPPAKTILIAGLQTLSATFTPTNTSAYNTVTATVNLQVNQATPPVLWVPVPIVYGTPLGPLQLDALTPVPGVFVYTPPAGTVLHAGNQSLSATFTPNDTTDFLTITVHATLVVLKANPDLDWSRPAPITVGTPLSATQLDATANVPGMFVYKPPAGTILPAGTDVLTVTFTPTDTADYQTVSAQVSITVKSKVGGAATSNAE